MPLGRKVVTMDNLHLVRENADPKRAYKMTARGLFGWRIRWNDGDGGDGAGAGGDGGAAGGAGGSGGGDWKTSVAEELRTNPHLTNFKSVDDLAKSWINAQKLIGKEKLVVPTDKDAPEVWDMVYNRLGRPEKPDGYKLPDLKRPDGYPVGNPEEMKEILTKAHQLGLNNKQIAGLYEAFMQGEFGKFQKLNEDSVITRKNAETELRRVWGNAFQERVQKAEAYVNTWSDAAREKLKASGLNNDPDIIQALYATASKMSEDGIGGKPSGFSMSPDEAKAEIARIRGEAMNNPKHPYVDRAHPEHEAIVKKMQTLFEFAHA